MKVFVTGAAGFIGRASVEELLKHGHTVLALARSDSSAETLRKLGAEVHRGDLEDLESLKAGAAASEGVLHLGFVHDFSRFAAVCQIDQNAIAAMGSVLSPGQPLVIASGTLGLIETDGPGDESTPDNRELGDFSKRAESGDLVRRLSDEKGIRGMVIRFSPSVHGKGDGGFVAAIIQAARKSGKSVYIEGSDACWPEAHRLDTAALCRLALEKGKPGATYHGIAEQGVPVKDLAELIGRKLELPVEAVSFQEAQQSLGFFAMVMSRKNPVSSEKTQQELGWKPTQPGWLEDVEENYFTKEALEKEIKY
ncbi:uncharacterized protein HMPREF1541_06115 [Cyphellophora europaea CBS 101466]|uniref:NAD-dependent epimerase/dehydratase domain-containing protein n=1 Tax=Cyphellophora europaea (strain CBS 101466) TaxID=1220924 RepID=W2RW38_CYPE1|nr:uncharacterized protein HMPREF1541_06115 [Cyphellophora europaea CBS 101466]ETN39889.1 hypothetical protein HMPREF1541_06115 [Cyphellophora europaea CBS 101466]